MLFAEELGPVGWSAIIASVLTAIVAAFTTVFNLRRNAQKEDKKEELDEEKRILVQYQEMFERQRKQCDDDKRELNVRIDGLEKRVVKAELRAERLQSIYVQEVARRRYAEGVLKQHKIELETWDNSTADLPSLDTDPAPPPATKGN